MKAFEGAHEISKHSPFFHKCSTYSIWCKSLSDFIAFVPVAAKGYTTKYRGFIEIGDRLGRRQLVPYGTTIE
jgi:hypothetical protein